MTLDAARLRSQRIRRRALAGGVGLVLLGAVVAGGAAAAGTLKISPEPTTQGSPDTGPETRAPDEDSPAPDGPTPDPPATDVFPAGLPMLSVFERPQRKVDRITVPEDAMDPASTRLLSSADAGSAGLFAAKRWDGEICAVVAGGGAPLAWQCAAIVDVQVQGFVIGYSLADRSYQAQWWADGTGDLAVTAS
ncbi:hypothetical protein QT381_02175 [Galbitalea sp. SE-J8]|uniref:hypothetical protein n=1 Tax=Galbitalea sp. SE-J8 TaxID=3054952 RepID=UPI00259CABF6|nr:hypothetical protein [Galbitalea sp. SE-J8]MDM4761811.1 hypothetical protein [Galbitalea sp. SE-J8]